LVKSSREGLKVIRHIGKKIMPWISLTIAILLSMFIASVIVLRTDFFANNIARIVNRNLFGKSNFSLRVKRFEGNVLNGITAHDVYLRYTTKKRSFDFLRADAIRVRYNLFDLLKGKTIIDSILVVNPHVWIRPDTSGVYLIPEFSSQGPTAGSFGFEINSFRIIDGQVIFQAKDKADFFKEINLSGSIFSHGDTLALRLIDGEGLEHNRDMRLKNISGLCYIMAKREGLILRRKEKREIVIETFRVSTEESDIELAGKISPSDKELSVRINIANLDMEELAGLLKLDRTVFGEITGSASIDGNLDSLVVGFLIDGVVQGYRLEEFSVTTSFEDSKPGLISFAGVVDEATITGNAELISEEPAGVKVSAEFFRIDLSKEFVRDGSLPSSVLNGEIDILYRFNGARSMFSAKLYNSSIDDFGIDMAIINGAYNPDTLRLDEVLILHSLHNIRAHGSMVVGGKGKVYIDLSCKKDDVLFELLGIEDYRANLDLNGLWEGGFDDFSIYANGNFSDLEYPNIYVPSGVIKLAIADTNSFSVQVDIESDSCTVLSKPFSKFLFSLEYRDGVTDFKRIELANQSTQVNLGASLRSAGDKTLVRFSTFSADFLGERWTMGGSGEILFDDEVVEVNDIQLHSRAGAFYLSGEFDRKKEEISSSLDFERVSLSILKSAGLIERNLAGKGDGRVELSGDIDDPSIRISMRARALSIDTLRFDSLLVSASYSDRSVKVDSLSLFQGDGFLALEGEVGGASLKELFSGEDSVLSVLVCNARVESEKINIKPIRDFIPTFPLTGGYLSGSVEVRKLILHPDVFISGKVDGLSFSSFKVPSIVFSSSLENGQFKAKGKLYLSEKESGEFRVAIPVQRKHRFFRIDPAGAISLDIAFPDANFASLASTSDYFAEASGKFSFSLKGSGTAGDPHLFGEFNLRGASFRIAGMEENFKNVNARFLLDDTVLTIYSLTGSEGKKGKLKGSGTIILRSWKPEVYNLSFNVEDFFVGSIPDIVAIVSGSINVGTEEVNGKLIPSVNGALNVKSAEVYYELGGTKTEESGATLTTPSWLADIAIEMPGNVWVKTPDASIEMEGDITYYHDNRGDYIRGELKLIRGYYNVYNSKFKITSGTLRFATAEGFRPIVDIEAETTDPGGRKIFLTLVWHQDDIEPRLSLRHEDPGYSETDIWKMLGGGIVETPGSEGASWDAVSTAQNLAANYIERLLNSQMQGITVELETRGRIGNQSGGKYPEKETVITIGKYLSQGLYVKYKQGLSITSAREIDAEYRISRFFLIRSELIRYSEKALGGKSRGSTDEINLDLRVRFEFW